MFSDNYKYIDTYNLYLIETTVIKGVIVAMRKITLAAISILIIIVFVFGGLWAIGEESPTEYGRDSTDFEIQLIYATLDGMETKYKAQSPIVMPKDYLTCEPESQYDYIMNGEISLLNEYGTRITYSFSAYIMNQSGYYYVVDSIVY